MPPAKPAIDARTDTTRGAPGWPASPSPRKAIFPVINAVKIFPKARKLIASTAPDESVSAASSQLRILTWLSWRSTIPTGVVKVLMRSIPRCLSRQAGLFGPSRIWLNSASRESTRYRRFGPPAPGATNSDASRRCRHVGRRGRLLPRAGIANIRSASALLVGEKGGNLAWLPPLGTSRAEREDSAHDGPEFP